MGIAQRHVPTGLTLERWVQPGAHAVAYHALTPVVVAAYIAWSTVPRAHWPLKHDGHLHSMFPYAQETQLV